MRHLIVVVLAAMACVGAGATAGPAACGTVLHFPLSEENLRYSTLLGLCWGVGGALIAMMILSRANPKMLWFKAVCVVVTSWFVSFAAVYLKLVLMLG